MPGAELSKPPDAASGWHRQRRAASGAFGRPLARLTAPEPALLRPALRHTAIVRAEALRPAIGTRSGEGRAANGATRLRDTRRRPGHRPSRQKIGKKRELEPCFHVISGHFSTRPITLNSLGFQEKSFAKLAPKKS